MLRGGCFCRTVRYEIDAEPTKQTICHCTMCRHAAGAPSVAWFSVSAGLGPVRGRRAAALQVVGARHALLLPELRHDLDLPIDAYARRPRRHDLLARRARPGGAEGPYLRAVEAFVGDDRGRPARLSDDAGRTVDVMNGSIRPATLADADAIAALHAASWRSAYRGILKDSTLGPTLDDDRRSHWRGELAAMAPADTVLIADGQGFIAAWAEGDPGFGAYIDNLHVHPERRSGGLGRQLLGAAMRQVAGSRRGARLSLGVRRQHACHRILSAAGRRDRRTGLRRDRRVEDPAEPHRLARHAASWRRRAPDQAPVISLSNPKKARLRTEEIVQSTGSDWKPSSKRSRLMR